MCWNPLSVVLCSVVFCALFDFGPSRVLAQLSIKPNYDISGNKIGEYKSRIILQCDLENPQQGSKYSWKWYKDDKEIFSDSEDPHHIDVNENILKINRFVEDDGGIYTCKLMNINDKSEIKKDFNVILKPYLKLPKTATYIEGEKVELECIVHAVPLPPQISWKFENTTIKTTNEKYKFLSNKNNVSNAILVFNPITMAHRGNYVCIVEGVFFVESNEIYVRIKDKMAALWPFLGICAEVVILCLIIFIYEKKRNKAEFEESDTDQGPETNNANDHSGGDVRHRK